MTHLSFDLLPRWLKEMPPGAQRVYESTFNNVLTKYGDQAKAARIAREQVGRKYKKVGEKWVLKGSTIGGEAMKEALKRAGVEGLPFTVELMESLDGGKPLREATIDRDSGIVRNICILSPVSKNNRVYTPQAIANSVRLFEGTKAFANHPKRSERGEVRDVRDLIGKYFNIRVEDGKLRGDLEVLESHKNWVFPLAEQAPELVGMSINAQGKVFRRGEREMVESITSVRSVDLVSEPAATISLFESISQKKVRSRGELESVTLNEIKRQRGDLVEEIRREDRELIERLQEENRQLMERLKELEARDGELTKRELMESLLSDSQLPRGAITETFKELLLKAGGETKEQVREEMQRLITDRESVIFRPGVRVRGMGDEKDEGLDYTDSSIDNETFIHAVKKGVR